MSISRRDVLKLAGVAGAASVLPGVARSQSLEKKEITIAVGGQALIYYLPLSIASLNGYFKDEGLDINIMDFAGGSRALQAVVGGSADIVSGAFEHTISLQAKGQEYCSFVQQGRAPMIVLAVSRKTLPNYKGPEDLKGKKIGVTAPGSSTNMAISFYLSKFGIKPSDVSFIGVGGGSGAVTALRTGQIDAISNLDPVIGTLLKDDLLTVIADTRTIKDTIEIFGGNMPSGCLYASRQFIEQNPNTTQALANAMVRASKWIQKSTPDEIAKVVPESYLLGDVELYKSCLAGNKPGLSPDGSMPEDGPRTALNALAAYTANFPADKIDLSRVWNGTFVAKANEKYPNV